VASAIDSRCRSPLWPWSRGRQIAETLFDGLQPFLLVLMHQEIDLDGDVGPAAGVAGGLDLPQVFSCVELRRHWSSPTGTRPGGLDELLETAAASPSGRRASPGALVDLFRLSRSSPEAHFAGADELADVLRMLLRVLQRFVVF